jgi:hypothetical protein
MLPLTLEVPVEMYQVQRQRRAAQRLHARQSDQSQDSPGLGLVESCQIQSDSFVSELQSECPSRGRQLAKASGRVARQALHVSRFDRDSPEL